SPARGSVSSSDLLGRPCQLRWCDVRQLGLEAVDAEDGRSGADSYAALGKLGWFECRRSVLVQRSFFRCCHRESTADHATVHASWNTRPTWPARGGATIRPARTLCSARSRGRSMTSSPTRLDRHWSNSFPT